MLVQEEKQKKNILVLFEAMECEASGEVMRKNGGDELMGVESELEKKWPTRVCSEGVRRFMSK
jgi:hypothetical protein